MALNINTNTYSQAVQKHLATSQSGLMTSMQRLSSGMRINGAADDAAGLAISDRMNSLIKSQNVALRNVNDGTSMMQVADGAAGDITSSLQRMKELATQAANGTLQSTDRDALNTEYSNLASEISRTAAGATFNGASLLTSSTSSTSIQIGAAAGDTVLVSNANLQASALLVDSAGASVASAGIAGSTGSAAQAAMTAIDAAINSVNSTRAGFGASMNRLSSISSQLSTSIQNQNAAKSRITDTDYASETANLSRTQVLQQAGMAMLSQANSLPQQVLSLLR